MKPEFLSLPSRTVVAPPPTDMSAMSLQAAKIRSNSADIAHLKQKEDILSRVPSLEEKKTKNIEKSDNEDSCDGYLKENSEGIKESLLKKDTKKKKGMKVKMVKRQDKERNNKKDNDDEDSDESGSGSSEDESTDDSTDSYEDSEQSSSNNQADNFEFDIDGRSSYEVMGFRSAFPTSRPPIIKGREKESRAALKWVANDCTYAAAALRRARPKKTFAAGFFDRIETLRRVVLSELAKARSLIEALAAAGIAFDREMLIISAEEIYSREGAKKKVCETKPGNFEELAAELEVMARKSKLSKGTQRMVGWKRPRSPLTSKPKKLYLTPFRQEGIGLLYAARCPRAKTASASRSASRRRSGRQYVGEVEGMEASWCTKDAGAMVEEWSPTQVERSCATCKWRGRGETKRGDNEGIEDFTTRWGFRERQGTRCGADLLNTQKGWYEQTNTRFKNHKQIFSAPALHSTWSARGGASDKKFEMAGSSRFETWLPTSGHGATSKEVLRRKIREGNDCFNRVTIRSKSVAVCLHTADRMASTRDSQKIPVGGGGVHRRLPFGVRYEGEVGGRNQKCQELLRGAWCDNFNKEGNQTSTGSRVYWSYMGCDKKDGWSAKNKKIGISKSSSKFVETCSIKEHVAQSHRQTRISSRSSWPYHASCSKPITHSGSKAQRSTHRGNRRSKGRPRVVEGDIKPQDRTFSRDSSSHREHRHRCKRWRFRIYNKDRYTRRTRRKQSSEGGKFSEEEHRGAYKQKGNRGNSKGIRKSQGGTAWKTSNLVFGFSYGFGSGQKTRDPEAVKASLGNNQEGFRSYRTRRDKTDGKTCAREIKWGCRRAFSPGRGKDGDGEGNREGDKEMGAFGGGPMRGYKRSNKFTRRARVGSSQSTLVSKNRRRQTGGQTSRALRSRCRPTRRSNNVGLHGGANHTTLARSGMVARGGKNESRLHSLRSAKVRKCASVVAKERALARLDGIFNPACNPLWAEKTRAKHEGTLFRFLLWQEEHGLASRRHSGRTGHATRGLRRYIYSLSRKLSGEALVFNARSLLTTLRGVVSKEKETVIRNELPILRKKANKLNPPKTRAADPVRLESLRKLLKRAKQEELTNLEKQALDIFVVAFVTMSRVEEIRTLKVSHLSPKCDTISLRPKMNAGTELRITKYVTNTPGLRAVDILRKYKEEAIKQGRKHLFKGLRGKPPETHEITMLLKKVTGKLKISNRITSHSARKGAAVEAVLAGVPLPVVQALGDWKDINSLQVYIGDSIRRCTALLGILKDKGRTSRGAKRKKREGKRTDKKETRQREEQGKSRIQF